MNFFRTASFFLFLLIWTLLIGIVGGIVLLTLNRKLIQLCVGKTWGWMVLLYLRWVLGLTYRVEGIENVPTGPCIIACKHQSAWETCFLVAYLKNPVFILKKELLYIPIYGWYLWAMGMIAVERGTVGAIKKIQQQVHKALAEGREIVIFPEGTRVAPDADVPYKKGIYTIYQAAPQTPIVPVALNSGRYWPRKSFAVKPGCVTVKFLPPIQGELNKVQLMQKLKKIIDTQSNKL